MHQCTLHNYYVEKVIPPGPVHQSVNTQTNNNSYLKLYLQSISRC